MMNRQKKLLIIGSLPPPAHGCNVFVRNLLDSEVSRRFDVVHLDTSDRRSLATMATWDFTNVALAIRHLLELIWICLKHRPALAHFSISQNIAGYLRDGLFLIFIKTFTLGRCRVAIHLHGSYFLEFYKSASWWMQRFIDVTLRRVDRAIVLGQRLRPIFQRWLPDSRIAVAPNGSARLPSLNGKLDRNGRLELRIVYLGNLYRSKGVLDLIDAGGIVLKQRPGVKFRLAGNWAYDQIYHESAEKIRAACEARVAQTGVADRFEFLGELSGKTLEDYLVDGDVFVFPSLMEGMPLVLLEAMAAGNPVVSTRDVGAIPEVIQDGENGILVEKQNPQALAQALLRLIDDPALRRRLGNAARRRFEEHYTTEKSFARLARVFEETLTGV